MGLRCDAVIAGIAEHHAGAETPGRAPSSTTWAGGPISVGDRQMPDAADELAPHGLRESFEAAARSTRDR